MKTLIINSTGPIRILGVLFVAVGIHLIVILIRRMVNRFRSSRLTSKFSMIRTIISLVVSTMVFVLYFVSFGLILEELGFDFKKYLVSASIIGLAVGFGSQGLVQDIVTGLTIIFSNLFHIGDMAEIAGQTGIVSEFGIRFTVLRNYLGADVIIPNRTITTVINYPRGYIRGIADVQLPADPDRTKKIEDCITTIVQATYERFPGILIREPSLEGHYKTVADKEYLRIKFRIWPGQGAPLETYFKREAVESLKSIDPDFMDWMIVFNYEIEEKKITL